jgi:energy-coupling factor transporter ATP-binding protein EcfA2
LISHDTKLSLPRGFDMRDLEAHSTTLVWSDADRRFSWREADLANLAVTLELPLEGDRLTELVREVGRRAKDAVRVEVPFHSIIPSASDWWQRDSRAEIEVPLGRAGAKKLQYLKLGRGTSQHVLISGKTGSGKSTLLNAIITSLAVHYSPEELQFYLIDFKKGVEFKAYATHRLPHARVIAIESEREFGLSVLERLDQELKNRGDLFRKAGVQDLKSYRNSTPDKTLPRILLVIDEFQEFFTSDDKIAHDSALLLDRLVRQGRAFGIHVMLGSQTLAGAYSLARSTLGQMAVRIALQCSESDAHLILSEDNTAARLLSRPGEAIYNDANGLLEGNHPFQVVWLPDAEREQYLQGLHALSNQRGIALEATTVFEGNVPAEPRDNPMLVAALDTPATSTTSRAWLGAAVAIKDPTCASFRRQAGSNLLIVGQQEEMAVGILANSMISLSPNALRRTGSDAPATELSTSIYVLDGTQADSPLSGTWPRIAATLDANIQVITPREAAETLSQLAAEVERRLAANDPSAPSIFVVIHHLARFRDLKKSEDFGMSSFSDDEGAVRGDKCLATLLREGPSLGIHTMIWCDSYNNFYRWVERPLLRDLDQRVLFQMSAADSSNLIDSPAASKLGEHMALFYSEELGQLEKFRPYEVPTITWLDFVADKLRQHRDAKTHA